MLKNRIIMGLGVLAALCIAWPIIAVAWLFYDLFYGEPLRQQQAREAMNIYPGASLIHEADIAIDTNNALNSYFYVTDDSLETVQAYYLESGEENVIVEGEAFDYLQTHNDLEHLMSYGRGAIATAHEGVCGRKTYAECLSVILLDLDDDAGATLIVISYRITFL